MQDAHAAARRRAATWRKLPAQDSGLGAPRYAAPPFHVLREHIYIIQQLYTENPQFDDIYTYIHMFTCMHVHMHTCTHIHTQVCSATSTGRIRA